MLDRTRNYLWWEIDLSKQGLGDLRRIKTKRDLYDLAQSLDPQKSIYERRAIIEAVSVQILKMSCPPVCSRSKNWVRKLFVSAPRKLKSVLKRSAKKCELDPPIFMPECICRSQDIATGFRRHNILPLHFFGREYQNIGDLHKIPDPFYPEVMKGPLHDYSTVPQISLMRKLMSLPTEIRYHIYEYVAFASPAPCSPETTASIFEMGIARRTKVSRTQPKYVMADKVAPDYFRESEYRNIEGFLETLREFEGRQWCPKRSRRTGCKGELRDSKKLAYRRLGVLNDFLDWLLDNIFLDFTFVARRASYEFTYGGGTKWWNHPPTCPAREQHLRISHITFTTPYGVNYTELEKPFVRELRDVAYLCRYIKKNLRGLRSIRVFFKLRQNQAEHFLGLEKEPEWLFEMNNNLPIVEKFEWYVSVVENNTRYYEEPTELKGLTDLVIESLKEKLRPRLKPGFLQ